MKKGFFCTIILLLSMGCDRRIPSQLTPEQGHQLDAASRVAYIQDTSIFLYDLSRDKTELVAHVPGDGLMDWSFQKVNDSVVMVGYKGCGRASNPLTRRKPLFD
jgi:hypothetical protein